MTKSSGHWNRLMTTTLPWTTRLIAAVKLILTEYLKHRCRGKLTSLREFSKISIYLSRECTISIAIIKVSWDRFNTLKRSKKRGATSSRKYRSELNHLSKRQKTRVTGARKMQLRTSIIWASLSYLTIIWTNKSTNTKARRSSHSLAQDSQIRW